LGKFDKQFVAVALEKYKETLTDMEFFKEEEFAEFPKGSLVKRKSVKKVKNKIYTYDAYYIEITEYINKKKHRTCQYVRKSDVEKIRQLINKRNAYKRGLRKCNADYRPWKRMIDRYVNRGIVDYVELNREIKKRVENKRQAYKHRRRRFDESKGNPAFKVITTNGDFVRSKNEAFVAELLKTESLEYMYEYMIMLKSKRILSNIMIQNNVPNYPNFRQISSQLSNNDEKQDSQTEFSQPFQKGQMEYSKPIAIHPDYTVFTEKGLVYIELLGKMDDENYRNNWMRRQAEYEINGIKQGKNLVCLACHSTQEIDCVKLRQVIQSIKQNNLPSQPVNLGTIFQEKVRCKSKCN